MLPGRFALAGGAVSELEFLFEFIGERQAEIENEAAGYVAIIVLENGVAQNDGYVGVLRWDVGLADDDVEHGCWLLVVIIVIVVVIVISCWLPTTFTQGFRGGCCLPLSGY